MDIEVNTEQDKNKKSPIEGSKSIGYRNKKTQNHKKSKQVERVRKTLLMVEKTTATQWRQRAA